MSVSPKKFSKPSGSTGDCGLAKWLIQKAPDVRRYWARLADREATWLEAFEQAELSLSEKPYPIQNDPGVIKHLKGGFHCNHEYRTLPNAQRIFYKIWTRKDIEDGLRRNQPGIPEVTQWGNDGQLGVVVFFYAGPHPR